MTKEPALFSKENIKPITVKRRRYIRAVEIINIVRIKAFSCINEVIKRDCEFFSDMDANRNPIDFSSMYDNDYTWIYKDSVTSKAFVHPFRILTQHIGYISNYINFVEQNIPISEFEERGDKDLLLKGVKEQLESYVNKLNELIERYPSYFRMNVD